MTSRRTRCIWLALLAAAIPAAALARSSCGERDPLGAGAARTSAPQVRGFVSISKLVYSVDPERPHQLVATYRFPDRARLWYGSPERILGERTLIYRHADKTYGIARRSAESRELEGEEARLVKLQIELRRAVMSWPEGFDWQGEGERRTVALGELGSMQAELAQDGERAASIVSLHTDGEAFERYRIKEWRKSGGRSWPAALTLESGGKLVWTETVESIDPGARFVDSFFLPPDRRASRRSVTVGGTVRHVDLPARITRRVTLESGLSWERALGAIQARRSELERGLPQGVTIHERCDIEVDEKLRPLAYIARLKGTDLERAPEGWSVHPPAAGLSLFAQDRAQLDPASLRELRDAGPVGAALGKPYVRMDAGGSGLVQLVLPILP